MTRIAVAAGLLFVSLTGSVHAQDVRGLEVCTAEKDMVRRTSCLQANVQFLQGALDKAARDAGDKLAAANRELAAQKAEHTAQKADIAALKDSLAKMQVQIDELKKAKPAK